MSQAAVRYIVDDADAAVAFYRDQLGFDAGSRRGQILIEDPSGNPVELFQPASGRGVP